MSEAIIKQLGLVSHPEGGYFRRTYCSDTKVKVDGKKRAIGSAIYYYLSSDDFSAWHRIDCDEMWHFYMGSDLIIHLINEKGELNCICLGDMRNGNDVAPQCLIPANTWFAVEVSDDKSFALVGCDCFPEFTESTFELAKREELMKQFPQHQSIIERLTRK